MNSPSAISFVAFSIAIAGGSARATTVLIDEFVDGALEFATDTGPTTGTQGGSMFGGSRWTSISVDRRQTVVTASLVDGGSGLLFSTGSGTLGGLRTQGHIQLRYTSDEPVNLLGATGFIIDFGSVTGTGEVNLNLNMGGFLGSASFSVDSQTTQLFYPIDSVYLGDESLDEIDKLQLTVFGTSADFSTTLRSVTAIPEPGLGSLLLLSLSAATAVRNRRSPTRRRS